MIRKPAVMQFCSGQLMQFLSGVDTHASFGGALRRPSGLAPFITRHV
jgi:hypothetical protein